MRRRKHGLDGQVAGDRGRSHLLDAVRVLEAETELARWRRHGDGHSAQLANDLVLRELAPFKMGVDHLPRVTKGGG